MTQPSLFGLGELRYINQSSTLTTAFVAASEAAWTSATKLAQFEIDLAGLKQEAVKDGRMQTSFDGRNPDIKTKRTGSFSFKMYLEGGASDITAPTVTTLLGIALGGIKSPATATDAAEGGGTTTSINATAHGMFSNQAVLVGVAGDTRGGGKIAIVDDATSSADAYTVKMALPDALSADDVLKNGHTVYVDPSTVNHCDFLYIGDHAGTGATDDPDQYQMNGCVCSEIGLGGIQEGTPWVQFTFVVSDWRRVPYASKASFTHTAAPVGDAPVGGYEFGQFAVQDNGTTTRNEVAATDIEIAIPMNVVSYRNDNNPNCIGGWRKTRTEDGPSLTATVYLANLADLPGLEDDFEAGTAKQVLYQIGHTTQQTVSFYLQKAYLKPIDPSGRVDTDGLVGLKIAFEAASGGATDLSTDDYKLQDAAITIHFN